MVATPITSQFGHTLYNGRAVATVPMGLVDSEVHDFEILRRLSGRAVTVSKRNEPDWCPLMNDEIVSGLFVVEVGTEAIVRDIARVLETEFVQFVVRFHFACERVPAVDERSKVLRSGFDEFHTLFQWGIPFKFPGVCAELSFARKWY